VTLQLLFAGALGTALSTGRGIVVDGEADRRDWLIGSLDDSSRLREI
jgi:hypothetical protein